jgi:hypothetical protein
LVVPLYDLLGGDGCDGVFVLTLLKEMHVLSNSVDGSVEGMDLFFLQLFVDCLDLFDVFASLGF